PLADLGRGQVADVVDVEYQQCPAFGSFERLLGAAEPVAMQTPVIDAFLEVDAHDAECGQRASPVVARVDVLGVDLQRIARSLVHGVSPLFPGPSAGWLYSQWHGRIIELAAGPCITAVMAGGAAPYVIGRACLRKRRALVTGLCREARGPPDRKGCPKGRKPLAPPGAPFPLFWGRLAQAPLLGRRKKGSRLTPGLQQQGRRSVGFPSCLKNGIGMRRA